MSQLLKPIEAMALKIFEATDASGRTVEHSKCASERPPPPPPHNPNFSNFTVERPSCYNSSSSQLFSIRLKVENFLNAINLL